MPEEMAMLHPVDGMPPDPKGARKEGFGEDRSPPPARSAEPASKAEEMMAFLVERQRRNDPQR
jgi:hypothetical protein